MQPVLEDDALLFSLDDVLDGQAADNASAKDLPIGSSSTDKVSELEEELARLRAQFADYRLAVEKTLDDRWTDSGKDEEVPSREKDENHQDPGYFDSYSYNGKVYICRRTDKEIH